jgi:LysM repeat protein
MAERRGTMLPAIVSEDRGKRVVGEKQTPQALHESATSKKIVVRSGDTLSELAQKHGVTLDSVMKANAGITNPNMIRVGQKINIPTERTAKGRVYKDWARKNPATGRTLGQSVRGNINPHTRVRASKGGLARKKFTSGKMATAPKHVERAEHSILTESMVPPSTDSATYSPSQSELKRWRATAKVRKPAVPSKNRIIRGPNKN